MRIVFRGHIIRNLSTAIIKLYRIFIFMIRVIFGVIENFWSMALLLLGIDWFQFRRRIENKIRIFIS